jgi:hypothetical protein
MANENLPPQEAKHPHMGEMVEKVMNEKGVNNTVVSEKISRSRTGVARYKLEPSLQGRILWKLGLVLQHNFFADLSAQFPIQVTTAEHLQERNSLNEIIQTKDEQLKEKDQQIRDLEKELAIYKEIVLRK